MSNEKMRSEFEAWFEKEQVENTLFPSILKRFTENKIVLYSVWQAAQQASESARVSQPVDQQLLDFYNVKTANELIAIQEHHIKRLQVKLAALDAGKNVFRPTFLRG